MWCRRRGGGGGRSDPSTESHIRPGGCAVKVNGRCQGTPDQGATVEICLARALSSMPAEMPGPRASARTGQLQSARVGISGEKGSEVVEQPDDVGEVYPSVAVRHSNRSHSCNTHATASSPRSATAGTSSGMASARIQEAVAPSIPRACWSASAFPPAAIAPRPRPAREWERRGTGGLPPPAQGRGRARAQRRGGAGTKEDRGNRDPVWRPA